MIESFVYTLEKGSRKYFCPNCNKKTFVHYIDENTGEYLPIQYGRCDRESKCSYHLNPYSDKYESEANNYKNLSENKDNWKFRRKPLRSEPPKTIFFDFDTFKQTLESDRYEKNAFIQNLFYNVPFPFEKEDVTNVIQLYRLGTVANGYRKGATTFPFIDRNNNVRTIQVKQFDKNNHTTETDFLHSILKNHCVKNNLALYQWLEEYVKQDKFVTCLFGEHLLEKYPHNPVALVEAPKTAIYGTLYFGLPKHLKNFIWLAIYNKSSFSFDKLKVLSGREIFVLPDLSKEGKTYNEWLTKAKEIEKLLPNTKFTFSNLLEKFATEKDKSEGKDIADYLIRHDWSLFRKQHEQENDETEPEPIFSKSEGSERSEALKTNIFPTVEILPQVEAFKIELIKKYPLRRQKEDWSKDIDELENYFARIELPISPLKLNSYSTIANVAKFIESHFATIKTNNGNRTFLPYLNRLFELQQLLNNN